MPFVIRFPLEQAVKKLEEVGLRAGNIGEKSIFVAGVRFGDVIQQEPKGGMLVERGSTVDLVVAKKGNFKPDLSPERTSMFIFKALRAETCPQACRFLNTIYRELKTVMNRRKEH